MNKKKPIPAPVKEPNIIHDGFYESRGENKWTLVRVLHMSKHIKGMSHMFQKFFIGLLTQRLYSSY